MSVRLPAKRVLMVGLAHYGEDDVKLRVRVNFASWEEEKLRLLGRGNNADNSTLDAEIFAPPDTLWYPSLHETVTLLCPVLRVADRAIKARRRGEIQYTIVGVQAVPTRTKSSSRIHRFLVRLSPQDLV